jgi:lipoprotein NlpI
MVAANDAGSTIDFPRRNERAEEQMAFGPRAGVQFTCASIIRRSMLLIIVTLFAATQDVRAIMNTAIADFRAGRVEQSLAGFDQVARISPADAPYLWQRGIAQYYAGKFRECRDMFVSHRTVNPDDVENAAWHFLCVARAESPEAARQQMLPVGPDARVPMREVYRMFKGELTQAHVMKAAGADPSAQFFARLYVGLYLEATGNRGAGRTQIEIAAEDRFARAGGYMHDVARVHIRRP